jgi:hypothetical protein
VNLTKNLWDIVEEFELTNCLCKCYMKSVRYSLSYKMFMWMLHEICEIYSWVTKCLCECYMKSVRYIVWVTKCLCECYMKSVNLTKNLWDIVEEFELTNCLCKCYMKSVRYSLSYKIFMWMLHEICEIYNWRSWVKKMFMCECYMKFMRHTELKNLNYVNVTWNLWDI